jgi:hypothetical protein
MYTQEHFFTQVITSGCRMSLYILQHEVITYVKECSWMYILQPEVTTYVKKCSWAYILQPEVTTYLKKCGVTSGCRKYTQEHFFI